MSRGLNADLGLKLRLRRVLFCEGFWSPIEVELSHYERTTRGIKRSSLTDLDVLGIAYDRLFSVRRVVGDCKTGRHVSDANRLFWLRGVMDYFGADQAYFVRPKIEAHAKAVAPKMKLRVLDERDLLQVEKSLDVDKLPFPLADPDVYLAIAKLWGISVPKREQPSEEQLKLKPLYSYLTYSYWYLEQHRNLFALVDHFQRRAASLSSDNARHVLLAFVGAERFAQCLLDVANHVQAQGGSDVGRYARIYLYGGPLALKDKEQFFELLRKVTGANESLDSPAMPEILELLNRMLRNPGGASDILRHITAAYLWCTHLGHAMLPTFNGSGQNTAAVVLAKDVCLTFAKVTGLSEALYQSIQQL
jgi:hypothetical protein